jgi:MFS family permease
MIAPVAGRLSDKHGSRWVLTLGMSLLAGSYVWLWLEERARVSTVLHLVALAIGVIVLDMGAQMCQVANQTRIFGLDPSARSRLNTVYMTVYFGGAAVGSALATLAWVHWRWNGVCTLALGLMGLAVTRHITGCRAEDPERCHATREDELMEA